jgi:hypothetical protein
MSDDEGENYDNDEQDINDENEEQNYEVNIDMWDPSALPENPNDVYNDDEDFKVYNEEDEEKEIEESDEEEEIEYEVEISEEPIVYTNIIHRGNDRITTKIVTKYEKSRTIGIIASMLEDPNFNVDQRLYDYTDSDEVLTLAEVWFTISKIILIPLILRRIFPNGEEDWWFFEELILPEETYLYSGEYPL